MKKRILTLYLAMVVFFYLFILGVFLYDINPATRRSSSIINTMPWTDFTITSTDTSLELSGNIITDETRGNLLCFFTAHQNVNVYINEKQIYQFPAHQKHVFAKTPGYSWNFVPLTESSNDIRILITTPYRSYLSWIPEFMVGDTLSIVTTIINHNIFAFVVCIIIFCLGICMIGYWLSVRQKLQFNRNLLLLGFFACLLSIWSINELRITTLILHNNIVSSYVSFFSLMLLPIPFALFVKSFYNDTHRIWHIYCAVDVLQILICLLLQFFKIFDLRETLWSTHTMIVLLITIVVFSSFQCIHENKRLATKTIVHLICIFFCAIMLSLDIISYYFNFWNANQFGRLGFLTYFVVLGITATRETALLIKLGQKANTYQHLAYTDQMTHLSNRTAFDQAFTALDCHPQDVAIIDLDLNNLKLINDSRGHNEGDKYITQAAQCIHEVFHLIGKTYRVGGDEFVVLIENASAYNIEQYMSRLDRVIHSYGEHIHADYMDVAHGYAIFDPNLDRSLKDTYNRADKNMYFNKQAKKNEA